MRSTTGSTRIGSRALNSSEDRLSTRASWLTAFPAFQESVHAEAAIDPLFFCLRKLYMLSAIAHAWHPSHNLEIAPPPAFSPEVLPIVTTRSMGYVGEWKRKSNDSGAGDVMAPCGPKPRSICITAWPCNCSCVAVVVVDGIQATGRGWPLACDETMFRFQGKKGSSCPPLSLRSS